MYKTELKAKAARYVKIVEWSDEDACFVGTCLGPMFGGFYDDDETKVHAEPCEAEEEVIDLMEREGHRLPPATTKREFGGKVLRRLAPAVHRRLAPQGKAGGESLDALMPREFVTV